MNRQDKIGYMMQQGFSYTVACIMADETRLQHSTLRRKPMLDFIEQRGRWGGGMTADTALRRRLLAQAHRYFKRGARLPQELWQLTIDELRNYGLPEHWTGHPKAAERMESMTGGLFTVMDGQCVDTADVVTLFDGRRATRQYATQIDDGRWLSDTTKVKLYAPVVNDDGAVIGVTVEEHYWQVYEHEHREHPEARNWRTLASAWAKAIGYDYHDNEPAIHYGDYYALSNLSDYWRDGQSTYSANAVAWCSVDLSLTPIETLIDLFDRAERHEYHSSSRFLRGTAPADEREFTFGMEWELMFRSLARYKEGLDRVWRLGKLAEGKGYVHAERDGSLDAVANGKRYTSDNAFEAVFAYRTLDGHRAAIGRMAELENNMSVSEKLSSLGGYAAMAKAAGIHVHVGCKYSDGTPVPTEVIAMYGAFIQNPAARELVTVLASRGARNHLSFVDSLVPPSVFNGSPTVNDQRVNRYSAVNLRTDSNGNATTFETRIFRSTPNWESLTYSIEFVASVASFCRDTYELSVTTEDEAMKNLLMATAMDWEAYVRYVTLNAERFPMVHGAMSFLLGKKAREATKREADSAMVKSRSFMAVTLLESMSPRTAMFRRGGARRVTDWQEDGNAAGWDVVLGKPAEFWEAMFAPTASMFTGGFMVRDASLELYPRAKQAILEAVNSGEDDVYMLNEIVYRRVMAILADFAASKGSPLACVFTNCGEMTETEDVLNEECEESFALVARTLSWDALFATSDRGWE